MADKKEQAGKPARAPSADRSPEAAARAEKAQAAKDKAAAKKAASEEKKPREPEERVTPRLRTLFDDVVRKDLTDKFGYKNRMQVPMVTKIVVNMGVGEGVNDRKKIRIAKRSGVEIDG
jgi:large subunit ribosomal protein L5